MKNTESKSEILSVDDDVALGDIKDESLLSRIKSFELREQSADIYREVNRLSVVSLKARLKGDDALADDLIDKTSYQKAKARELSELADLWQERANKLASMYYRVYDLCDDDWMNKLKDDRFGNKGSKE